ncbi:hypothetical protein B0A52_03408 [Exophiala mesophila]|uniref:Uncharacterized protein n=1 Tax=Exophiala mesophila TaxID=212818 RepID=A0A438N5K8_EXOME|nr:hypothetical protein B0A52_03408 [Exophiala mesophila]
MYRTSSSTVLLNFQIDAAETVVQTCNRSRKFKDHLGKIQPYLPGGEFHDDLCASPDFQFWVERFAKGPTADPPPIGRLEEPLATLSRDQDDSHRTKEQDGNPSEPQDPGETSQIGRPDESRDQDSLLGHALSLPGRFPIEIQQTILAPSQSETRPEDISIAAPTLEVQQVLTNSIRQNIPIHYLEQRSEGDRQT